MGVDGDQLGIFTSVRVNRDAIRIEPFKLGYMRTPHPFHWFLLEGLNAVLHGSILVFLDKSVDHKSNHTDPFWFRHCLVKRDDCVGKHHDLSDYA